MNIRKYATLACTVLALALATQRPSTARAAENWPQWHGPDAKGVGADGEYPVDFNADKGVAWKIDLPGLGMSTPAVWDDLIFVTCGIDGKDAVVAYDFKGEEKWRREFGAEAPGRRQTSSGSNPSPVTDGKHLVLYYGSGKFACLDLAGKVLWEKNLQDMYGKNTLWWDVGNSPVIAGDRVVVAVMQGTPRGGDAPEGASYIAAFDLDSGDLAWKTPREYERPMECDDAYTTPMALTVDGRQQIVLFGADHLTGYDPADGKLLWDVAGFNPKDAPNFRSIASPVTSDSLMLIPFGRAAFLAGVRLGGANPEKLWEREKKDFGSDVPTPVARDGKGYVLTDKGRVECLDIATGAEIWSGSLPRNRHNYFASPVLAGNLLYCAREDGMVYVVDVSDGFKQVAENNMGEQIIATPVPVRGGVLIRGDEHLFWIRGEEPKESQTAG